MVFKQVEKIIQADGWRLVRITGSHYQYKKVGYESTVEVPNYNEKNLSAGTMKNLERITGLSF